MNIFISTTTFGEYDKTPLEMLAKAGADYLLNPHKRKLNKGELLSLAKNAEGLVAGTESLTADVLHGLPQLKVISRCGTGLDNVDLEAAKRLKIAVFNTPDAPTDAVAELTIGLILDVLRKISQCDRNIRSGIWKKPMGMLLKGKKVGIIGSGRIGSKVAFLAAAFGAQVLAYDVADIKGIERINKAGIDELLEVSDIISIHMSGGAAKSIGDKEINRMKNGVILINTSRGSMIDETALYEGLKSGKISGAGIDVFEKEPYKGALTSLDNVVLTAHIGSYAKESRILMEKQAVENLLKGLEEIK